MVFPRYFIYFHYRGVYVKYDKISNCYNMYNHEFDYDKAVSLTDDELLNGYKYLLKTALLNNVDEYCIFLITKGCKIDYKLLYMCNTNTVIQYCIDNDIDVDEIKKIYILNWCDKDLITGINTENRNLNNIIDKFNIIFNNQQDFIDLLNHKDTEINIKKIYYSKNLKPLYVLFMEKGLTLHHKCFKQVFLDWNLSDETCKEFLDADVKIKKYGKNNILHLSTKINIHKMVLEKYPEMANIKYKKDTPIELYLYKQYNILSNPRLFKIHCDAGYIINDKKILEFACNKYNYNFIYSLHNKYKIDIIKTYDKFNPFKTYMHNNNTVTVKCVKLFLDCGADSSVVNINNYSDEINDELLTY